MKRIGFIFKVNPARLDEYKAHHKAVWPEMQEALRRAGWHNYSLFIRPDGQVFGYFETPVDLQTAQAGMEKEAVNARWQALMAPYFEGLGGLRPDQGMLELEEIFHLD